MQEYAKRLLFFIETRWNVRTRIAKRLWSPSEEKVFKRLRWVHSLRADEIKLWLTPSAKQRRNSCSGLPAVYPDLSTRHDWPVKKGLCFVCRDRQSG